MITIFNDFLNENYVNKFDFQLGKSYEYDELPKQTKQEIDIQVQDNHDESIYDYTYKFTLLQPEDTEEYLMKTFDPYNLGDVLETPHMKDLIDSIKDGGLDYPSVGIEGNHRALIHWYLKKPLPYLEMIKKEDINESLRDKLKVNLMKN